MPNKITMELFIIAFLVGLGAPIFAILGSQSGDRLAKLAYVPGEASDAPALEVAAIDFSAAVMGSPGDAEKGSALFQANCTACHGPMADGKGAAAASLTPPPRNFLDPAVKWTRSREPKDVYQSISEGSPGTSMIGFAGALSVQDRWAIVHYLGTLEGLRGKFSPVDEAMAASWKPDGTR